MPWGGGGGGGACHGEEVKLPGGCVQCHQIDRCVPMVNAHPTAHSILSWVQSHWSIWGVVVEHHGLDHRQGFQSGSKHQHLGNVPAYVTNQGLESTSQCVIEWVGQGSAMETTITVAAGGGGGGKSRARTSISDYEFAFTFA